MTEDEAKTKWCPFAREASSPGGWNRAVFSDGPHSKCIGSQCMAWRWTDQQTLADAVDWVRIEPHRRIEDFKARNPTNGVCGLAGRP